MQNYKKYTHKNFFDAKSSRVESSESSEKDFIFDIFNDLQEYFKDGDEDEVLDILNELSDCVYERDHLPQNFNNFFISNQMFPIISKIVEEPLNNEILSNIIEIVDKLVTISIQDDNDFHQYLYDNGFFELLIQIRDSIPFNLIPYYIHLVANFSYINKEVRNQILNQYTPQLLNSLIFEQGEININIRRKASFLIWRMSMYKLDDSVSDFLDWIIDFFAKYYLDLTSDENSLMYWLFTLDNIIEQEMLKPIELISYGYSEILYYFIKTRKHFFIQIENENENNELEDVENEEDEIVEISDKDQLKIDDLLEIVLKIIYFLINSNPKNVSELLIYDLLDISSEEWKKCSSLSIKIICLYIRKSKNTFPFNEFNEDNEPVNIISLLNLFESSAFSVKYDIILILQEIVISNNISDTFKIGVIIIPFLLDNLESIDKFVLIKAMLDVLERILYTGVVSNGKYQNKFFEVFDENGGFDFLNNYQDMIFNAEMNEEDVNCISNLFSLICEYFPSFEEEEEEASYQDQLEY